MKSFLPCLARALPALAFAAACAAEPRVLAEYAGGTITDADIATQLHSVPQANRDEMLANAGRLGTLVNSLMVSRLIAADARKHGTDTTDIGRRKLAQASDRALEELRLAEIAQQAGEEFDRSLDLQTARAKEIYLVNAKQYEAPERVRASHILIDIRTRKPEEARALAEDLRAKALAGADFGELAARYSDDGGSKEKSGDLGFFAYKAMVEPFAKAAFALNKPGEISPVVETRFGFHVIRLAAREPARRMAFDEVKTELLQQQRDRFVNDARAAYIARIQAEAKVVLNKDSMNAIHDEALANVSRRKAAMEK